VTVILPGIRVHAAEKSPADASGDAVVNADRSSSTIWRRPQTGIDDTPRLVRSIRARTMSTLTVMDKSTKQAGGVKCAGMKARRRALSVAPPHRFSQSVAPKVGVSAFPATESLNRFLLPLCCLTPL